MNNQDTVRKIMTTDVHSIELGRDLYEAKNLMAKHKVRHLPVLSEGKLVGIISQTDILRLSFGQHFDDQTGGDAALFEMLTIEHVMVSNPNVVDPSCTIRELSELFIRSDFHAFPVVDGKGKVVGIVSTTDLIRYYLEEASQNSL